MKQKHITTPDQDAAELADQTAAIAEEVKAFLQDTEQRFEGLDESLHTQGRTGHKLQRINFAFSDANYDYIKVMAGLSGETMTALVNRILDAERRENIQYYIMAKNLQARMKGTDTGAAAPEATTTDE